MPTEITYKISFSGKLHDTNKKEVVINKIATLFDVSPSELLPIFNGVSQFQRTGLNQFTAKWYYSKFKKIGAVLEVEQENEITTQSTIPEPPEKLSVSIEPEINTNCCPKCHSTNINSEKCLDCGIYIDKYKISTPVEQVLDSKNETTNEDDSELLENKSKAIRFIKYAVYYLIVVFTVDSYTSNNRDALRFIVGPDFDVGLFPYVMGSIALAYGCYYLALVKGRSVYWGLLGLISLPGLCVLLLLSDKNNQSSKVDIKVQIFSYAIIILSFVWSANFLLLSGGESTYVEKGITLRELRHEYPSTTFDSNSTIFQSEIKELNNYLDEGFKLLSDNNFDHAQIVRISDAMFSETMRAFIWINYQRYLQYRNGYSGIEFLEKNNIKELQIQTYTKIQSSIRAASSNSLTKAFSKWFKGGSDTDYNEYKYYSVFFKEEFKIRQIIRELTWSKKLPFEPPQFSFDEIELPQFSKRLVSQVKVDGDIILFTFTPKSFKIAGKTLVLGYYYETYQRYDVSARKKVDNYLLQVVQLSPDFPSNILNNDLGVFDMSNIIPLFDPSLR